MPFVSPSWSRRRVIRQAELLRLLLRHRVRFIVVGGAAAVIQGVPITTLDVDIVYDRSEDNLVALEAALAELGAVFRTDDRKLRPDMSRLRSTGHKLLITNLGVLDVLATIEDDVEYGALLADSEDVAIGDLFVRVLTLERLIEVKTKLTRPKDRLMLEHLKATLDEKRKGCR